MDAGTAYFESWVEAVDLDRGSALPGWTGRHVAAHVAANARALGRLAHWARTGEERPMYASPQARDAEIEELAGRLSGAELAGLVKETAVELRADLWRLSEAQWEARVRTAQGRVVPATEIVWMRTREVWVHGVDLGGRFEDLPGELVDALVGDVVGLWRMRGQGPAMVLTATDRATDRATDSEAGGQAVWRVPAPAEAPPSAGSGPVRAPEADAVPEVRGTAAELAAWLTGRGSAPAPGAPAIGRWL
ncbi:maleylpyruvate isomerase family mycothiol-dependent enzyme [Nonomuraea sp. SYSU D8015]|uniref:maleylpyruvate isomerase family mycothiol-dependent enzyme n=1 Tax=Nonomuraea sp. SYSU D8015 TaxID=2593644 RepID=UPI00166023EA|nr:maleylpyruvate isomerase family mycothiol-dependent enzyme [Nonomuraea sp. SYSU D8015]